MHRPTRRFLPHVLIFVFIVFISMPWAGIGQGQPRPATRHGELEIEVPWARATPPAAKTGAVYLTLTNRGQAADRLLAASSPAAAHAELHAHLNEGGVMRMKAIDAVVLPPAERLSLRPGGLHVMLMDLKAPLREGTPLRLTLSFARAGEVTLEVPVLRNPPDTAEPRH